MAIGYQFADVFILGLCLATSVVLRLALQQWSQLSVGGRVLTRLPRFRAWSVPTGKAFRSGDLVGQPLALLIVEEDELCDTHQRDRVFRSLRFLGGRHQARQVRTRVLLCGLCAFARDIPNFWLRLRRARLFAVKCLAPSCPTLKVRSPGRRRRRQKCRRQPQWRRCP